MNACIVTQERTLLGERTIVGLTSVKDAVKFYDPENLRPEKIAVTDGLLRTCIIDSGWMKKKPRKRERRRMRN